jgi:hemolysin III
LLDRVKMPGKQKARAFEVSLFEWKKLWRAIRSGESPCRPGAVLIAGGGWAESAGMTNSLAMPTAASPVVSPVVSRGARLADACIHVLGVTASIAACVVLAAAMPWPVEWVPMVALGLYAVGLVAMLGCSAAYNLAAEGRRKRVLRRFDHAAIFVMIAGTYSPVSLLGLGGAWGWGVAGFVWAGALVGAGLKLCGPGRFERVAVAAYLLLGWVGIVAIVPLVAALPALDLAFLGAGGLLYSLGVIAHVSKRMPYQNAIWHGFVLAAAACHFVVVLRLAARVG